MNKLIIIGIAILSFSCQTNETINSLSSHNEDDTLMVFAPELALEGNTYKGSFSDDLNTFYFFRKDTAGSSIFIPFKSDFKDGKWGPAEVMGYYDKQYSYTYQLNIPGTDQLIFISTMKTANDSSDYPNYNFWSVTKSGDNWSNPEEFGSKKLTDNYNSQPSITNKGTIYFSSWTRDYRNQFPYKMEKDGNYTEATIFEAVEKWRKSSKWRVGPFAMDPDEKFMILTIKEDDNSNDDLYISYSKNEKWTAPTKLGASINTAAKEGFPYLTPDGKFLIFSRAKSQFYIVPTKQLHISN